MTIVFVVTITYKKNNECNVMGVFSSRIIAIRIILKSQELKDSFEYYDKTLHQNLWNDDLVYTDEQCVELYNLLMDCHINNEDNNVFFHISECILDQVNQYY